MDTCITGLCPPEAAGSLTSAKFIEFEDSQEQEKKDLQGQVESLESRSRQLEHKAKNYADQISRLDEREGELKKEYNSLHLRHTEMIHNYMEHLERIKIQQLTGGDILESGTLVRVRKERPVSLGIFPLSGGDPLLTPDAQRDGAETPGTERWRFNNLSHPRSNTSLKDELSDASQGDSKSVTPLSTAASDVVMHSIDTPIKDEAEGLTKNLNTSNSKPDSSKIIDGQVTPGTRTGSIGSTENEDKSEVQAIIESTPELDMNLSGYKGASTPTKGIENRAFDRNTESLFEELSSAGSGLIGDVDEGADLLGMGREVENLILENTQLLETKNALNVVKNDLIAQVDELSCEKEVLQGELVAVKQAKQKLEEKNKELEEELKNPQRALCDRGLPASDGKTKPRSVPAVWIRTEAEEARQNSKDGDDDSDVPTAQRKRFTRVEMARVLMERNQYKERLMELQEAVRWTEMISFSRLFSPSSTTTKKPEPPVNVKYNAPTSHITPTVKKRSTTLSQLPSDKSKAFDFLNDDFSRLFSPSSTTTKKPEPPVNVKYNAPTSHITPTVKKRSTTLSQLPSDKSKAFDFLNEETDSGNVASRREQKRVQYQQVKAHVQKEDGRIQAYGWSLPQKYKQVVTILKKNATTILQFWHVFSGARETDYPAGEEIPRDVEPSQTDNASLTGSVASNSSAGSDSMLGGITVVSCTTESTAVPQTARTPEAGSPTAERLTGEIDAESSATTDDGVPTAEEATEATEANAESGDDAADTSQPGIYTEHVFTDPLGVQNTSESSPVFHNRESELCKDDVSALPDEQDLVREEAQKMSSALPTMWLGAQNGWHVKGRVLVALADGTLAIFHRGVDGQWDLTNYHLLDLGRPHHSIRCMTVVHDKVWCGYRNKIYVVQPKAMKIEKSFDAHPRKESQVRQLAWVGDGVWVSIRLDSTLRLYHAHTYQHLQDVDIEPYVSKMLGTGKLGFSFVRITALMVSCNRLWVGTGNGVIISIPLTESNKIIAGTGNRPGGVIRVYGDEGSDKVTPGTFIPYCSMAHAQLCFHGHRDAVKFFTAVPGQVICPPSGIVGDSTGDKAGPSSSDQPCQELMKSLLVMSGGEGYIDFRMGDEGDESEEMGDTLQLQPSLAKAEQSHLIVWQTAKSTSGAVALGEHEPEHVCTNCHCQYLCSRISLTTARTQDGAQLFPYCSNFPQQLGRTKVGILRSHDQAASFHPGTGVRSRSLEDSPAGVCFSSSGAPMVESTVARRDEEKQFLPVLPPWKPQPRWRLRTARMQTCSPYCMTPPAHHEAVFNSREGRTFVKVYQEQSILGYPYDYVAVYFTVQLGTVCEFQGYFVARNWQGSRTGTYGKISPHLLS
ncbi:UNVERIFIED_CONTAM: hypothetical protein FKN15_072125 [Acipenser sinensis]